MAKWCSNSVLDGALDVIATATILCVCSAQPTTRTEAVTTYALATVVVDASDFTNGDGDVSGRKVTVGEQASVAVTASGDATHVALCDGSDLLYVTTMTTETVTIGNTVTVPAWDIEIRDPA